MRALGSLDAFLSGEGRTYSIVGQILSYIYISHILSPLSVDQKRHMKFSLGVGQSFV